MSEIVGSPPLAYSPVGIQPLAALNAVNKPSAGIQRPQFYGAFLNTSYYRLCNLAVRLLKCWYT